MAKLTREDVLRLAKLSSLQLTDKEVDKFTKEIEAILGYVEQLHNAELDNLPATTQVTGLKNITREDETRDYKTSPKELLSNAPEVESGHIKVQRMIV